MWKDKISIRFFNDIENKINILFGSFAYKEGFSWHISHNLR